MTARPTRRAVSGAVAALSLLALAGCSSGADSRKADSSTSGSTSQATPVQVLAQSKGVMDKAASMHLVLTSKDVPQKVNGVLKGEGVGTHAPAFKGTLTASLAGLQADVPVTAVDHKVWAKLPIWPNMRIINPKDYGAPDPAKLFSTSEGISSLLPRTQGAAFGGKQRDGQDVVQTINGTLPGTAVTGALAIGDPTGQYKVIYAITDKGELRTATLTGHFFNDATSSYTIRLDQYGKTVDITPPA